ncbi:MAG: phosphohydrolase [Desulfuromonas thiophila]|nr:phosphohydrolase [Desulfuromonas thiophila]MDY0398332.1 phosphohydrolase [Desulfuromonas thiophila]
MNPASALADSPPLRALRQLFSAADQPHLLLVGGSVRDLLLGRSAADTDLLTDLPGERLRQLGFSLVQGKTTAPIWFRYLPPFGAIEISPLPQLDQASVVADLSRRDFTINALALDLTGQLIDPLTGREDLARRLLRPCSTDSFSADPLRLFRALRFAAAGWQLHRDCGRAARQHNWQQALQPIAVERFSRELVKALATPHPERFFLLMLQFNLGHHWLPQLWRFDRIPAGPPENHPEGSLLRHAVLVLRRCAGTHSDPLLRFCAFFHDLGKLATTATDSPRHTGHDQAGVSLSHQLVRQLRLPRRWGQALAAISQLHSAFNRWPLLAADARLQLAHQAIKADITVLLPAIALADKPGSTLPADWPRALQCAQLTLPELGIRPDQLARQAPAARAGWIAQQRLHWFTRD